MIIDTGRTNNKYRKIVIRVCDDCGQRKESLMQSIRQYRNKRGSDKDYCHKCSYKYRVMEHPTMEKSASWNGGRYLNENGYYRVYTGNLKYEYEHKVLLSKYLGRKLTTEEKVHHIDLNKSNNNINNLFLCKNKTDHWACHQSMEECAFSLFNKEIWFDRSSNLYVNHNIDRNIIDIDVSDILALKTYMVQRRNGGKRYAMLTNGKKFGCKGIHALVAEKIYGRQLMANETVHHINGNTIDNNSYNICVMTRKDHKKCHYSLQNCVAQLFRVGIIGFSGGKYYVK